LFLLIAVAKPVFPEALVIIRQKLSLPDSSFLDQIIQLLAPYKFADAFTLISKVLADHYRSNYEGDFGGRLSDSEKAFYQTLLGLMWTWTRLIVLRGNSFNMEAYKKEMAQFLDDTEYQNHDSNPFTIDALDYTFNAIKFA